MITVDTSSPDPSAVDRSILVVDIREDTAPEPSVDANVDSSKLIDGSLTVVPSTVRSLEVGELVATVERFSSSPDEATSVEVSSSSACVVVVCTYNVLSTRPGTSVMTVVVGVVVICPSTVALLVITVTVTSSSTGVAKAVVFNTGEKENSRH
jgi:hypothetical protein